MPFSFSRPTWLPGALLFGETHKWGKNNAFTRILETRQSNLMFHLKMTLIKHLNNNLYKGRRAREAEILRWWRSCCDRSARDGKLQRIFLVGKILLFGRACIACIVQGETLLQGTLYVYLHLIAFAKSRLIFWYAASHLSQAHVWSIVQWNQ